MFDLIFFLRSESICPSEVIFYRDILVLELLYRVRYVTRPFIICLLLFAASGVLYESYPSVLLVYTHILRSHVEAVCSEFLFLQTFCSSAVICNLVLLFSV